MSTLSLQAQRLVALLLFVTSLPAAAHLDPNAPCYYPGGDLALGYFPCEIDSTPISSCCPGGWTCFSNALCIATTESDAFPNITLGAVQRGACTNPQWNNNICGSACLDPDDTEGSLIACGNDRFCCESDFSAGSCNCSSSGDALIISAGLPQTIIQVTDTSFTGTPSLSIATSAARSTVTTTSRASSNSTSIRTSTRSATTLLSTTLPPPLATSTTLPDSNAASRNSEGLMIGLGVGITLGVVVLAAGLLFFLLKKKKKPARGHVRGGRGSRGTSGQGSRGSNPSRATPSRATPGKSSRPVKKVGV
ncbi:hypothetical protein B0T25DRAFT_240782 [Lasiosphaeria hispida]|uniref:Mid2 domain-containing protein n=1 Tax=Lasiosphaeria hispida TaxID=260671 RepID=A0AAJ0HF32_9PEZI|nr:hypothetical protein B0T25DRAFT_240782 [Lasiosphaeria hispida]